MSFEKVRKAQELYANEIRKVQQSAEQWQNFLDFMARLQTSSKQDGYEFATKMIIHSMNPNATECREFGEWKSADGNHVNRGATGIPVLARNANGQITVTHLFDTSQTALHKEQERPDIASMGLDVNRMEKILDTIIDRYSANPAFSEQQRNIFRETAKYKLCKEYGISVDENADKFRGIEQLGVMEIANIGIGLNKCSLEFKAVIERSIENDRVRDYQSQNGRTELHGRNRDKMGVGRERADTHDEVHLGREYGVLGQAERGELDIRTNDRVSEANTNGSNGQVRQHETNVHLENPVPDRSDSGEWGRSEALRRNERGSFSNDRTVDREEKTVGRIQENGTIGQVSSESTVVGEIQDGSGGRNTSRDSIRNIEVNQAADSERDSAVLSAYENLKALVLADERIINAALNSDEANLLAEINKVMSKKANELLVDDYSHNKYFHADFISPNKSENRKRVESEIFEAAIDMKKDREAAQESFYAFNVDTVYEIVKDMVLKDTAVINAAQNSDEQNLSLQIDTVLNRIANELLMEDLRENTNDYVNFHNDFFAAEKSERRIRLEQEILQTALEMKKEHEEKRDTVSHLEIVEESEQAAEISDKITFEMFGGGSFIFRDEKMNDVAAIGSDGSIVYYSDELSEKDKQIIGKRAEQMKQMKNVEKEPEITNNTAPTNTEEQQLAFFNVEEHRPYQVITYDRYDGGADDKEDYATIKEAQKRAKQYLKDNFDGMGTSAYEGYAIYNTDTQIIEETGGDFPSEEIFSVDVLVKNGILTPEQADEINRRNAENGVRDRVIETLIHSDELETAAKNNTLTNFSFAFYDKVSDILVEMLDDDVYGDTTKGVITNLLNDEEYLHKVFNYTPMYNHFTFTPEMSDNNIENEQELTEKEKMFLNADIVAFMAKSELAWDEIEDLGYRIYEDGYINKNSPNEKIMFGNGLSEAELFDMVHRMNNGEDVRKDIAMALLGKRHSFTTSHDNTFTVEYGQENMTARYENAERVIKYEELGDAIFSLIKNEYDSILQDRTIDDLLYSISDITEETAISLISAFDDVKTDDWKDNEDAQRGIKSKLNDILSNEESAEKAFYSIANMKYNFKPERKPELSNNQELGEVSETTSEISANENSHDFDENAVKYAFGKIMSEHNYDFTNPTFMYLGHLQNYMIDHKIDDIITGATSKVVLNYYGNAPLTNQYFSPDYSFTRDLPEEYNKYINEYYALKEQAIAKRDEVATPNHDTLEVKIGFTESSLLDNFMKEHENISFALANVLLEYLDEKLHTEKQIPELEQFGYDKTDFLITGTLNGNDFSYEGGFDIGDGNGTGGGSTIIEHIRNNAEYIINNKPSYVTEERIEEYRYLLDTQLPLLENHTVLTSEEQQLFDDFKSKNPIRTKETLKANDIQETEVKKSGKSVEELQVGDYIKYDGETWEITKIGGNLTLSLENIDKSAELSAITLMNWKDELNDNGFEYVLSEEQPTRNTKTFEADENQLGSFKESNNSSETQVSTITWEAIPETADENGKPTSYATEIDGNFYYISQNPDKRYDIETYIGNDDEKHLIVIEGDFYSRASAEEFFEDYAIDNGLLSVERDTVEQSEPVQTTPDFTGKHSEQKIENSVKTTHSENIVANDEMPTRDELIKALRENRSDISAAKYLLENGHRTVYQDRAIMLINELEKERTSVPDAVKIMQQIGFEFGDEITYSKPDTSHIKSAFEKFKANHSELSERALLFLDRAEKHMSINEMYDFNDVITSKLMADNYGQPERINGFIFDGRLDEYTEELNSYLGNNQNERDTVSHSTPERNTISTAEMFKQAGITEESPFVVTPDVEAALMEEKLVQLESDTVSHSETEQVNTSDINTEEKAITDSDNNSPPKPDNRFRITNEHLSEDGGAKTKFRNNIEAIKTLQRLEREERLPTPEEQETLSKYVGWGGLQNAFDNRISEWNAEYYELKNLLTDTEYEAARATVTDAFYTSPIISKAIYEALENMGFEGGEILEPSMGIGNFFGTMPDKMRDNSNLSGIEIDDISGRIAKKLYPEASIAINGFEKIKPQKGSFDLAVGNVPFGNVTLRDNTKAYKGLLIHDYFFAKSLDCVHSGGIVAFVTSSGTLDKQDTKVRQMLAQKAELLGAIRLPDNAFKKNAGTETTTDIIFLQKRDKPLDLSEMAHDESCDWVHTTENADGYTINSYFAKNPEMILGTLDTDFRGRTICKATPDSDLKEQLHEAIQNIKGEYKAVEFQSELDEINTEGYIPATPDVENLTYTVVDDRLYFRIEDNLIPLKESEQHGKIAERRKAMCDLAETTRELLQAQVNDLPESEIERLQNELKDKYDRFAEKYGRINAVERTNEKSGNTVKSAPNSNAFKNDVRLPLLQSLEIMNEGQYVGKAEIFDNRTIRPHQAVEHVDTAHEALILSISEKGRINFEYMEQLTGMDRGKIISDLGDDIFPVPELSESNNTVYQTKDEYLSGNIYKKIAEAEKHLSENPAYKHNIDELQKVIPTPLKATEIDIHLGNTWLDPKIIQQFMYETFETPVQYRENEENRSNPKAITVEYSSAGRGSWNIENKSLDLSVKTTKSFGTSEYNAYEILDRILNFKPVTVTETVKNNDGTTRTYVKEDETKAAEEMVKKINRAFEEWIYKDPERRNALVSEYNERFNNIRPRQYDGKSLKFYGSNSEIDLKKHQKNAVAHALFGGNTLFAHEVGAGKTFEMIATAMEGKRLGLHNKSMFVVPNHLTEQIAADFMKLYPNANILVAKQDDFSPQKRRRMCARIATGNFDAVIIGHSQLIKIPLSQEREQAFLQKQIDEMREALSQAKKSDGSMYKVKEIETAIDNLIERLNKLINSTVKDSTVTFEEMGIDKLFVDEAHEFKNLYVSTKMENVSGLATNPDVQKTQDLFMKCQYLDELTGNKGVVFSTGTPVTNALSEMFAMQKYLQSDLLKEMGIENFDSWASVFTRKIDDLQISPAGNEWRYKTRLQYTNVPELRTLFSECADVKMAAQLELDVPECEKTIVSVEPTEIQKSIVQTLGERADAISNGSVKRDEDNMLVVTNDGRKLGLDQRVYDMALPDEPNTKVNTCIQNVFDIWERTSEQRSTQLIFCDLAVPQTKEDIKKKGKRFCVYDEIKQKLMEKGIPENEIAFIHDAKNETDKAKLFAKVRSGQVRVLIGSTQKMGAGTNVQKKLIALHDLDCPYRPADLTQRLGRMVRQGNENKKVYNFRYVTKGTFDTYLYQMVEKKQTEIGKLFTAGKISRTMDDIDEMTLDARMAKNASIGDERIRMQMELADDVHRLKLLRNIYSENHYALEDRIAKIPIEIQQTEKRMSGIIADNKKIQEYVPPKDIDGNDVFEIKVGNTVYRDKKEGGAALIEAMKKSIIGNPDKPVVIAEYKGFKIDVLYDPFLKGYHGDIIGENLYPIEFGDSAIGNITRIDNVISSVPSGINKCESRLEQLRKELVDSKAEYELPFEHEQELAEKVSELDKLTAEINSDKIKGKYKSENEVENTDIEAETEPSEPEFDTEVDEQPEPDFEAEEFAEEPFEPEFDTGEIVEEPPEPDFDTEETLEPDIETDEVTEETPELEKNTEDVSEKPSEPDIKKEVKTETSEVSAESDKSGNSREVTNTEKTESNDVDEPQSKFGVKWIQGGSKMKITYDSSAEKKITAYKDDKKVGECSPEQLQVTNVKGKYPAHITKCISALNIAFSENTAKFICNFIEKVKAAHEFFEKRAAPLFSKNRVLSGEFAPKSSKENAKEEKERTLNNQIGK